MNADPKVTSAIVLAALPGTNAEICAKTGFSTTTVLKYLSAASDAGIAFISRYDQLPTSGSRFVATWELGRCPDDKRVLKPAMFTRAEYTAIARERRANPAFMPVRKPRVEPTVVEDQGNLKPRRDAFTTAFFGPYIAKPDETD